MRLVLALLLAAAPFQAAPLQAAPSKAAQFQAAQFQAAQFQAAQFQAAPGLILPTGAISQGPAPASQAALCRAAIASAEAQTRIPDQFLSAIGRVESGRPIDGSGVTPWPWTINAAGTGHFYATKAEAVVAAQSFQAQGIRSIDVGCLQVNLMYHPDAFTTLEDAFDPSTNAAYAARLLISLFAQQGSWPRAAAAYHSQTPVLGQEYQQKVLSEWAVPQGGEAPPRATPPNAGATPPPAAPVETATGFGPVTSFGHSLRLPGAPPALRTGRSLAAYRAVPIRLASAPPMSAPPMVK